MKYALLLFLWCTTAFAYLTPNNGGGGSLSFPLLAPDVPGTPGAPSYSFNESGTDTGMYSGGDGILSWSNNGVLGMYLDANHDLYVTGNIYSANTPWLLTGNAGTGGAGRLGTTDAANWDIIAGNSTIATVVESYKGISAAPTIVPADATAVNQFDWRTYVSPAASTNGATHYGQSVQLVWDNPNAGFNNSNGNLVASNNSFLNNGSGTINYASTNTNYAQFSSAGTTQEFKGVTSENFIDTGATVGSYYGMVTGLNTTGGIVSGSIGLSQYANFTDAVIGNATGLGASFNFFGTTANSQGVQGANTYLQFNDTSSVTNGTMAYSAGIDLNDDVVLSDLYGFNSYFNIRDNADVGFIYGLSMGYNQQDASVSDGASAINLNWNYANTSQGGNVNLVNAYAKTDNTANVTSLSVFNTNPEMQGSSTLGSYTGANIGGNIRGSASVDNIAGVFINTQMAETSSATNFTALGIFPQIKDTATLTNGPSFVNIAPTVEVGAAVPNANGLSISMGNVNVTSPLDKRTINADGGGLNANWAYSVPNGAFFLQSHYMGGQVIVDSGVPTTAFGFGTNLSVAVDFQDDWGPDGFGIGFSTIGAVGQVYGTAGKTMNSWTGILGALSNPAGAGTLTNAYMFRAGGVLSQGGSLAATNVYGFATVDSFYCSVGTNCWAFYDDTVAENYLNRLALGTASKKAATNVRLEVAGHIKSSGAAPAATPDANAGTGATCTVDGTDSVGSIELVTGSGAWAGGVQCAIAFDTAYNVAPKCQLQATNSNAAIAGLEVFTTKSTTQLAVNFVNPDVASTTYNWDYSCVEAN